MFSVFLTICLALHVSRTMLCPDTPRSLHFFSLSIKVRIDSDYRFALSDSTSRQFLLCCIV